MWGISKKASPAVDKQPADSQFSTLSPKARGKYTDGTLKGGTKATYNPNDHKHTDGRVALSGEQLKDLKKISIEVPPQSRVVLTLYMSNSTIREIVFDNIGEVQDELKARLFLDALTGSVCTAEGDKYGAGARSKLEEKEQGPANRNFATGRKLTDLSKYKTAVLKSNNEGSIVLENAPAKKAPNSKAETKNNQQASGELPEGEAKPQDASSKSQQAEPAE